jgi:hypothetical protein
LQQGFGKIQKVKNPNAFMTTFSQISFYTVLFMFHLNVSLGDKIRCYRDDSLRELRIAGSIYPLYTGLGVIGDLSPFNRWRPPLLQPLIIHLLTCPNPVSGGDFTSVV